LPLTNVAEPSRFFLPQFLIGTIADTREKKAGACVPGRPAMLKIFIEEVAALASITLFIGTVAICAVDPAVLSRVDRRGFSVKAEKRQQARRIHGETAFYRIV
jgi:hypothetical protein